MLRINIQNFVIISCFLVIEFNAKGSKIFTCIGDYESVLLLNELMINRKEKHDEGTFGNGDRCQ